VLVEGDATRRPIDAIIANLNEIHQSLTLLATNPCAGRAGERGTANPSLEPAIECEPDAGAILRPDAEGAGTFEGDLTNSSHAQLTRALGDQVTGSCQPDRPNRYPFKRAAARRKSRWRTSASCFGPGRQSSTGSSPSISRLLVDTSRPEWSWRQDKIAMAEEVVRVMDAGKIDPTKQTSSEVRIWGGSKTVTCPGRTRTNTGREGAPGT